MVAASKMRKAQMAALAGRPYATLMNKVLGEVSGSAGDFRDPLMEKREVKKRAVILVSSDKGLCGGLNSNLMREATKLDTNTTVFITAGAQGLAVHRPDEAPACRGVHLQGRAVVCGGAGHFKICPRDVSQG